MKHFLAFDLGAESGRAMLGALANGKLHLEEVHRFPNQPVRLPTGLYWDTLRLFHEMQQGLGAAAKGRQLSGIGVDTWGVDFGILGSDGALVDNPRHYRDSRNKGQMERTFAVVPREQIFAETGLQFMQINSLFQWHAMKLQDSPALKVADTLLFIPDLLNYYLTGVRRAELTIVSTSQFYNPTQKCFASGLLNRLGLEPGILPPIVNPGTLLGPLRESDIPVFAVAGHDTASAVAAIPAKGDGNWCYISSGTWSLMGVEVPQPVINDPCLALNFTNEMGVEGRVRLLKNIAGLWLWQEVRRTWQIEGTNYSYDDMSQLAAVARPFVAILQPDAFSEPGNMPAKIAHYCRQTGQKPPETHAEICRVILEGLALRYRQVLESLEALLGRKLTRIHIVGGGSLNVVLNQFVADATQRLVIAGPSEATAAGNILVQALGAGLLSDLREIRETVRLSFPVTTFEPRKPGPWDDAYARFRSAG
ncbi:MAG TPA: rhamnulokinase family protein [Bryobacteraceae bacterium]|nr:rhamnulokinase family protein [Bryobacteraceae bacterium]